MGLCSKTWRRLFRGSYCCRPAVGIQALGEHKLAACVARKRSRDKPGQLLDDSAQPRDTVTLKLPQCRREEETEITPRVNELCNESRNLNGELRKTPQSTLTNVFRSWEWTPISSSCSPLWRKTKRSCTEDCGGAVVFREHRIHPTYTWIKKRKLVEIVKGNHLLSLYKQRLPVDNNICSSRFYSQIHDVANRAEGSTVRTKPPWNVMFFGTDEFAMESLKGLNNSRNETQDPVVGRLEVVTLPSSLPKGVPVKNYAAGHGITVHEWPQTGSCDQFDVGVVASFGRLLSEELILKFPYGILNVHPSCLPRWRGPAPIVHTVLNGDENTAVTVMQIRPKRFDVGPIVMQKKFPVPSMCTSKDLEAVLSKHGSEMLISVLKNLPKCLKYSTEQPTEGATFAPKVSAPMSCVRWEEQRPEDILRLERAIGFAMPLQTVWMGSSIKLINFVEVPSALNIQEKVDVPGSIRYLRGPELLIVRCKDGWVGIKTVILKKKLSAKDFYNGYLHQWFVQKPSVQLETCRFHTLYLPPKVKVSKPKQASLRNTVR
ncbi:methionyl-tRNA formyltransferase, mitochondrial [Pelobates cultripes]|uniref:Methionyl-tRNA formyltransferase, mitochondrial n=2 Tax=Pelobates cultripes TaxID=61616 RepID=A0AAD1RM72_PELCU|nr:methionyl-tRNA formyltransferase, mitochondrial [Pelobates cultripes]